MERVSQKGRAAKSLTSFARAIAAKKNFKGQFNYSLKKDRQKKRVNLKHYVRITNLNNRSAMATATFCIKKILGFNLQSLLLQRNVLY